jgi:hypothetical protein
MPRRSCKELNAQGKPCGGAPLAGLDVCIAHADEQTKAKLGFGGAENGAKGGKPRKLRTVDLMREWVEDHPEAFGVIKDALKAEKAVVVGTGPTAALEMVPDWPTRIVAFRELMDRSYGRPVQASEVTVITEDVIDQAIRDLEAELARNDRDPGQPGEAGAAQGTQSTA